MLSCFQKQEVETTSAAKNVTLTNSNNSALQITSVTPSGDFSLSSDGCSGTDLAPAASALSVSCSLRASRYPHRRLTIIDAAANSPQTVSLSGKGILLRPTFSPTHLSFGEQPLDVPTPHKPSP